MKYVFGTTYTPQRRKRLRIIGYTIVSSLSIVLIAVYGITATKQIAFETIGNNGTYPEQEEKSKKDETFRTFPIGVDPIRKEIVENPDIEIFVREGILTSTQPAHVTWIRRAVSKLALFSWYQNLASPMSRILIIEPGERKEQIAQNFGKILNWDKEERALFLERITSSTPELLEGKYYPDNYVVGKDATPDEVASLLLQKFNDEVLSRYPDEIEAVVPLNDTLTIASLLEREAYDFDDMRQISGVIWNRLFADMNLQIDATLQYAKGSSPSQPWWPKVRPQDKYIVSPYNTYKNEGLPPAPIANASLDAIIAALNPKKTDCMFYFHDSKGGFHCTTTYEEHVTMLKKYYGQGK
jgi:cell division protein YceG involved in septum cleavage